MNGHDDPNELPELTDEDVELLYAICQQASESSEAPFKALFAAYDAVFSEHQIDQHHDSVVFRYLLRIGEGTRDANRKNKRVNLVERLRNVLDALGIVLEDQPEGVREDITGTIEEQHATPNRHSKSARRRVSFDDARLGETWLSEHSEPVNPPATAFPEGLLSLPPLRGRQATSQRRARSTSSQRNHVVRTAAPKFTQHAPPSTADASEVDEHFNPTLYFEPSQTQLEQNAEAFLSTSALRSARQALHAWHGNSFRLQQTRSHAYSIAAAHDRRTLLRQALDQWRTSLSIQIQEHRRLSHLKRLETRANDCRNLFLLNKSFTHWATSCQHERLRATVAQRYVLKVTYFKRWRDIALENQTKVRRILVRKYVAVWRERTARRLLWEEQALAHYEESLMKKCKRRWFWHFCSRRVEGWHEQWIEKRALSSLTSGLERRRRQQQQAEHLCQTRSARGALQALCDQLRHRRRSYASANQHRERAITSRSLSDIRAQAKLAPIGRNFAIQVDLRLQHRVLRVWHFHLGLCRQATEVDRKRIVQSAWTDWNDALRCKALAQKIDERVLMENLYRWVLQERLSLFQRTVDGRLLGRAWGWWRTKVAEDRDRLADAEIVFAERQRRRRLASGMLQLNIAMRSREDAERTALELANSRALPRALDIWKEKTNDVRRLLRMAADARFYCLCSNTLRVWNERTSEHKANRRRNAYVQVRAMVKIRLVGRCFVKWRTACMELQSMDGEAERRAQARVAEVATQAFVRWRDQTVHYAELSIQAIDMDRQKLLSSALAAMVVKQAEFAGMDQQALEFKRETDLALLSGALRRAQWATFTVARKVENAQALWAKNRDQHIKQMIRHWAAQTTERRAITHGAGATDPLQEVPDSPSLRPASRTASRSAAQDLTFPSSPPTLASTPGYMRTPSRPRRAGRFRPLPTPVPFTPMAFESTFLATTPAPVLLAQQPRVEDEELFEALTPQVTPFARKLRAGGFQPAASTAAPPSALRSSVFGRSLQAGTGKSVRFAGSRFRARDEAHVKNS